MKQTLVVAFDDLDWTERQVRTPADETVVVQLSIELDLTEAHAKFVREYVDKLKAAGTPLSPRASRSSGVHQGGTSSIGEARQFGRDMRIWADQRNFCYRTPRGHFYPYVDLVSAYRQWLATGEEPDLQMAAQLRRQERNDG